MISKLDKTLNFHHQALGLRAARQELLASNIANSDTPNFKAKDIDFSGVLREKLSASSPATALNTTSSLHIGNGKDHGIGNNILYRIPLQPSIDGNTVDMDSERTRFADNSIKYDASITFINMQFRHLQTAMQER
ncbi:MAG: flagellar basal body rod protein FlgB [Nitrosomonas sp.]|nr:flagellar basal body rod protein FlgB [Nitrosomonas sp.]